MMLVAALLLAGTAAFGSAAVPGRAQQSAAEQPPEGAAIWPRFPFVAPGGVEPLLAVLYSPDDIGRSVKMESLGYPDDGFYRLHRDHPALRVLMMSTPANRYLGPRTILEVPKAIEIWQSIGSAGPLEWMELGGHGYTHSPPGDSNLHHHEFSDRQGGCNIDHRRMARESYCLRQLLHARDVYRALGIGDDRVTILRFPGTADTPNALRAARAAGFIAILGRHHPEARGRESWLPCGPDCEILEIEDSHLSSIARSLEPLVRSLRSSSVTGGEASSSKGSGDLPADGEIDPAELKRNQLFEAALQEGRRYVDSIVAGGGLLSITNHFWETFEKVRGVQPRYLLLSALLTDIEERFGPRVWYPRARELALWLELRHGGGLSWLREADSVIVTIEPPSSWGAAAALGLEQASLRVALPSDFGELSAIRLHEGLGGPVPGRTLDTASYRRGPAGVDVTFPLRGPVRLIIAAQSRYMASPGRMDSEANTAYNRLSE